MLQGYKRTLRAVAAIGIVCAISLSALAVKNQDATVNFSAPDTTKVEIASNRHAGVAPTEAVPNRLAELTDYTCMVKNETLAMWFNEKNASLRIVDRRSGYVWGSLSADQQEDMNEGWTEIANSLCTVEYYTESGNERSASLSSDNAEVIYDWKKDGLDCDFSINDGDLFVSFSVTLKADSIECAVKKGSVRESADAKLKSLYFMPFLGCVKEDSIGGYIFLPDGAGALMRFVRAADYVAPFQKKVYGLDFGIDKEEENNDIMCQRPNDFAVENPQVSCPVYGIVHGAGQNAFFAEITDGVEYTTLTAYPAGFTTDYHWASARFDYRQKYVQPTGQDGKGIEAPIKNTNPMIPKITYTFLTGEQANYSGFANLYRKRLTDRGVLHGERKDTAMPLQLTLIGSDVKKAFLTKRLTTLTTVKQADEILSSVRKSGIDNVSLVYRGALAGGLNGADFGTVKTERKLGSKGDFFALRKTVTDNGGRFYLEANPIAANSDQMKPAARAATTVGKEFAAIIRDNSEAMFQEQYLIRPTSVADYASALAKTYGSVCFDGLGYRLYSDSNRKRPVSRVQARQVYEKVASVTKGKAAYNRPNEYLWQYTNEYFDIPMVNSQYLYETDTVPFLQMVLKGSVDFYAPYLNQGFYTDDSILKMIEYGAYPSVFLMAADNYSLHNTPLEDYFSLQYNSWKDTLKTVYDKVGQALNAVEGEKIVSHRVLSVGVVAVTYSGGKTVVVNYQSEKVQTPYGSVGAKDFIVKED